MNKTHKVILPVTYKIMTVCQHYQNGFCKYRQQCVKKHVDELCPSTTSCNSKDCEKRHPRLCRMFAKFRHCKFTDCAYSHNQNKHNNFICFIRGLTAWSQQFRNSLESIFRVLAAKPRRAGGTSCLILDCVI